MKSRFLLPVFAVLFTAAVSFGISTFAATFTEPSGTPTNSNAPTPLDTSANQNTKIGGLLLNKLGASYGLIVLGRVGIGTLTPTTKLDVAGNIHSTGDVCTDLGGGRCLSDTYTSTTTLSKVTCDWTGWQYTSTYVPNNTVCTCTGTTIKLYCSGGVVTQMLYLPGCSFGGCPLEAPPTDHGYW